jgi:hypothetical protein
MLDRLTDQANIIETGNEGRRTICVPGRIGLEEAMTFPFSPAIGISIIERDCAIVVSSSSASVAVILHDVHPSPLALLAARTVGRSALLQPKQKQVLDLLPVSHNSTTLLSCTRRRAPTRLAVTATVRIVILAFSDPAVITERVRETLEE